MYIFGISLPLVELATLYVTLTIVFLVVFIYHLRRLRLYLSAELKDVNEFRRDVEKLEDEEEKLESEERKLGREEEFLEKEEEVLLKQNKSRYVPKAIKLDIKKRVKKKKKGKK